MLVLQKAYFDPYNKKLNLNISTIIQKHVKTI